MSVHAQIQALLRDHPVVLFMKGTRREPACGFSSKVIDILDEYELTYHTVNVLDDAAMREGIKQFSDWPTIPQLYVGGTFLGGSDIVSDMHKSGELAKALATNKQEVGAPEFIVTDAAMDAFRRFSGEDKPSVRLVIGRDYQAELDIDAPHAGDVVLKSEGLSICMPPATARRAQGVVIDFGVVRGQEGFKVDNPNRPPSVRSLSVEELDAMLRGHEPHLLLDVRGDDEREIANIESSVAFGSQSSDLLKNVEPNVKIVLYCHHGVRSKMAAEHVLRLGFSNVWNLEGGIDRWSQVIDTKVARY